jgi:hypothetical protein
MIEFIQLRSIIAGTNLHAITLSPVIASEVQQQNLRYSALKIVHEEG